MNNFQEQFKNEASSLKLSITEKSAMREALLRRMRRSKMSGTPSPYVGWVFSSRILLAGLLAIVFVGGGTVYAAQGALPGNPFYSIKVGVTEPMVGALQFSPEAKASWHAQVAERRLQEAETLAAQGELTAPIAAQIQFNFDAHAAAAAELAQEVADANPQEDGTLSTKIAAELGANSAVLYALASSTAGADSGEIAGLARSARTYAQNSIGVSGEQAHLALENSAQEKNQASSSTEVSSTSTRTLASSSATVPAEAVYTAHNAELAHVRDAAEAAIAAVESESNAMPGTLPASTTAQIQSGLANIRQDIASADASTHMHAALAQYIQALQTAISLKTYLHANAEFPQAHLLPALLQGSEGDSAGE